MTDWHIFYQCVQDELSWNRFHCKEEPYAGLSIPAMRDGKYGSSKLVAVPMIVPKLLHKKYIQMKMAPIITTEFRR